MSGIPLQSRCYIAWDAVKHPGNSQKHHSSIMIKLVNPVWACSGSQIQQASLRQQEQICFAKFEALNMGFHTLVWLLI